jgi:hypothetical protein
MNFENSKSDASRSWSEFKHVTKKLWINAKTEIGVVRSEEVTKDVLEVAKVTLPSHF